MKVELLAYTPEPEKIVAAAAKLCYSPSSISDITEGLTEEKTASFVDMLSQIGHESPIEHASFTFGVEGVSRSLLAQLTRHRIASFSVQSQRYVREDCFEYVIPPEIRGIPRAEAEFIAAMKEDQRHYDSLAKMLQEKHYQEFLRRGEDEKSAARKAEKAAIEDARFVLPNACTTKIIMTMNCRSLIHLFRLRCCNRAQWEIRELTVAMYRLVVQVAPHLFAKAGPSCVDGSCSEGKMSCGRADEVRETFRCLRNSAKQ
ncbi:MAG TPA: FAD-dependent thymidylate synthase [Clostridia bacterium]|nr:FAD-dependent thymidylate synthase [Clostridia bacterium]